MFVPVVGSQRHAPDILRDIELDAGLEGVGRVFVNHVRIHILAGDVHRKEDAGAKVEDVLRLDKSPVKTDDHSDAAHLLLLPLNLNGHLQGHTSAASQIRSSYRLGHWLIAI